MSDLSSVSFSFHSTIVIFLFSITLGYFGFYMLTAIWSLWLVLCVNSFINVISWAYPIKCIDLIQIYSIRERLVCQVKLVQFQVVLNRSWSAEFTSLKSEDYVTVLSFLQGFVGKERWSDCLWLPLMWVVIKGKLYSCKTPIHISQGIQSTW